MFAVVIYICMLCYIWSNSYYARVIIVQIAVNCLTSLRAAMRVDHTLGLRPTSVLNQSEDHFETFSR